MNPSCERKHTKRSMDVTRTASMRENNVPLLHHRIQQSPSSWTSSHHHWVHPLHSHRNIQYLVLVQTDFLSTSNNRTTTKQQPNNRAVSIGVDDQITLQCRNHILRCNDRGFMIIQFYRIVIAQFRSVIASVINQTTQYDRVSSIPKYSFSLCTNPSINWNRGMCTAAGLRLR
jgi:hypothetical protein